MGFSGMYKVQGLGFIGFLKIRGTFLQVPIVRTTVVWGLCIGLPFFWETTTYLGFRVLP